LYMCKNTHTYTMIVVKPNFIFADQDMVALLVDYM
jgi:hypothetical protein